MSKESSKTALLVFARSEAEEAAAKVLSHKGFEANLQIATELSRQLEQKTTQLPIPTLHFGSAEQEGECFGERLANAMERAFSKGFENLLVVGADTPDLSTEDLELAHQKLAKEKMVLGPSIDGGVYLIGVSKQGYNREAFLHIGWETSEVSSDFENYANQQDLEIVWGRTLRDLDNEQDVLAYLKTGENLGFKLWLLEQFFTESEKTPGAVPQENTNHLSETSSLRGPPTRVA